MPGPDITWMGDCLQTGKPSRYVTNHLGRLRLLPSVGRDIAFWEDHGKNKRGRPHGVWRDDIVEWCGENLQELSHLALDRSNWQKKMVKQASDVNGH